MSSTQDLTDTIQAIAINAGHRPLTLAILRTRLAGIEDVTATRDQIDTTLTEMFGTRQLRLCPEENQKTLTVEDREAALWLGGEWKHYISR